MVALLVAVVIAGSSHFKSTSFDCYDGDTCRAVLDLGLSVSLLDQPLRLCDIDAPEMRGATNVQGMMARDWLVTKLRHANRVYVEIPHRKGRYRRDKYGRWLAWIWACSRANECIQLNSAMVAEGHAVPYPEKCER